MDKSVAPGDDFYAYANGGVAEDDARSRRTAAGYGVVSVLADETRRAARRELIEDAGKAKRRRRHRGAARSADYYASFMDEAGDRGARA